MKEASYFSKVYGFFSAAVVTRAVYAHRSYNGEIQTQPDDSRVSDDGGSFLGKVLVGSLAGLADQVTQAFAPGVARPVALNDSGEASYFQSSDGYAKGFFQNPALTLQLISEGHVLP